MSETAPNWAEKVPDWAKDLPFPRSNPERMSASEVAELIRTKQAGVDFLIVDLRRVDWEIAYVRTSINLPAHSLYQSLPALLPMFSKVPLVIFYCQACSTISRGARGASQYQDALDAAGITTSHGRILTGGIKGWIAEYGEDETLTVKLK